MPTLVVTESSNNNYIRNQGFPNQVPFPTWNEIQDGTSGSKSLAGGTHSDLPVGQWNSDPGDPSIQLYKVYQAFGEISLSSLPEDAIITSVSMRTDIDANPAEGAYNAHIYVYDWGSTVGTSDWRTRAQVGAMTRIAVMTSPAGKGVGYEAWDVDQTDIKTVLEAALAAGDPTLKYMYVTTDFVNGNSSGDNVEEYIEYSQSVTSTEFTINYVESGLAAIMNGCIA